MDTEFTLHDIHFVANETKMACNPGKHEGVTFAQAAEAFFDPFLKVVDASRNDEARDAIIGMDRASRMLFVVLFVVHMIVEGEKVRLISARKATREERSLYEND